MQTIQLEELQADAEAALDKAQKERVVVIRNGKPSAVVVGIEGYDAEDLQLASSPEFWRMIEERRRGRLIPLAEVKARLSANFILPTKAERPVASRKKQPRAKK